MPKWEYKVAYLGASQAKNLASELQPFGLEGWELVSVSVVNRMTNKDGSYAFSYQVMIGGDFKGWTPTHECVFKRPL